MEDAVYREENLVYLCPTCHRKIHYGNNRAIRSMIEKLYERNKNFYDTSFLRYAKADEAETVLNWLYKMYAVD